jgi:hypothetical protein
MMKKRKLKEDLYLQGVQIVRDVYPLITVVNVILIIPVILAVELVLPVLARVRQNAV